MTDVEESFAILNQLRSAGFKLDLDDFGTGHSSLACLQEFRFDVLKIDRSFIQQLERSVEYDCFVQAITLIASKTGMQVVAEGIETPNQWQSLRRLNCQLGQGYYFSRPLPPKMFWGFKLESISWYQAITNMECLFLLDRSSILLAVR